MLAVTGPYPKVNYWPYRHFGKNLWAVDVDGTAGLVTMSFVETGRTVVPAGNVHDATGEVEDAVDAVCLLGELRCRHKAGAWLRLHVSCNPAGTASADVGAAR